MAVKNTARNKAIRQSGNQAMAVKNTARNKAIRQWR